MTIATERKLFTYDGDPDDFMAVLLDVNHRTGDVLQRDDFIGPITDMMNAQFIKATPCAGWMYVESFGQLPENGIITPKDMGNLVTGIGTLEFPGLTVEVEEKVRNDWGFALNVVGKMRGSIRIGNNVASLPLRHAADLAVGREATPEDLEQLGYGPAEMFVESMSGHESIDDMDPCGIFFWGGWDIFDIYGRHDGPAHSGFGLSGWTMVEDHALAGKGHKIVKKELSLL